MIGSSRFPNATGRMVPWLVPIALGVFSFALSCRLVFALHGPASAAQADLSVAGHMLGAARTALSSHFVHMTDIYFHAGGTGRLNDRNWPATWFRTMGRKIVPRDHRHVEKHAIAELAPMLWMAMRADPHNIETYLIAAYWFSSPAGLNRPGLAHEVLKEGRRRNPRNYRIRLEQARLFLHEGRLTETRLALDSALALWPSDEDPESDPARQGRIYALTYRALLYESDKKMAEAIALWKELSALQPDWTDIRERWIALDKGDAPPVRESGFWNTLIRRAELKHVTCDHDHDH